MDQRGFVDYDKTCNLKIINNPAYFNENGIANILYMGKVGENFRVVMDIIKGSSIQV